MARLTTIYPGSATNTTAINPTQVATSVNGQTGDVTIGAADITDLSEFIDDRVNSLLVAGTNVSKTYDDDANSLTLDVLNVAAGTHSHTSSDVTDFTEAAQDAAASLFTTATHSGVTATYSDAGATLALKVGFEIGLQIEGVMTSSEVVGRYVATRAFLIPSGATLSQATAGVAATASTTVTLAKNGSSFGTIVWSAAGTTGSFTVASDTSFTAGDVFTATGPASADATLANIGISIVCERT